MKRAIIFSAIACLFFSCEKEKSNPKIQDVSEAVDLGLSVKWAAANLGATSPEKVGDYYAWGETESKDEYSWATYKWCKGTYETIYKYNSNRGLEAFDGKDILDLDDDAAHVKLGGKWRMPTIDEFVELQKNCTHETTEFNGVLGFLYTSKINGNSIFFPVVGYKKESKIMFGEGFYWSSSFDPYDALRSVSGLAYPTHAQPWLCPGTGGFIRYYGGQIRPVMD